MLFSLNPRHFLKSLKTHYVCKCIMHVYTMEHVGKAENSFVESLVSILLYVGLEAGTRGHQAWTSQHLRPLSCLASPTIFLNYHTFYYFLKSFTHFNHVLSSSQIPSRPSPSPYPFNFIVFSFSEKKIDKISRKQHKRKKQKTKTLHIIRKKYTKIHGLLFVLAKYSWPWACSGI